MFACMSNVYITCPQCSDTDGWVTGRASGHWIVVLKHLLEGHVWGSGLTWSISRKKWLIDWKSKVIVVMNMLVVLKKDMLRNSHVAVKKVMWWCFAVIKGIKWPRNFKQAFKQVLQPQVSVWYLEQVTSSSFRSLGSSTHTIKQLHFSEFYR